MITYTETILNAGMSEVNDQFERPTHVRFQGH